MRAAPRRYVFHQNILENVRTRSGLIVSGSYDVFSPVHVAQRTFSSEGTPSDNQKRTLPSRQHWLDRRLPGLREWLDAKNRKWWLKGMQAWCGYENSRTSSRCDHLSQIGQHQVTVQCRKYPALQGYEQQLQALIEQTYQQFYAKHTGRMSDERSETHLQVRTPV